MNLATWFKSLALIEKAVFTEFDSSFIEGIAWEDHVLFVRTNGGTVYMYSDVPKSIFEAFMDAESKGQFYNAEVKNQYDSDKVVNGVKPPESFPTPDELEDILNEKGFRRRFIVTDGLDGWFIENDNGHRVEGPFPTMEDAQEARRNLITRTDDVGGSCPTCGYLYETSVEYCANCGGRL